jgi:PKD repeat protein
MRRGAAIWLLFIFLANALMVSGNGGADQARSGAHGRDTSRATTLIYNVYDLQNMSMDLKGAYELANDIEASATKNWNNGAGFAPVGNYTNLFNGTLDGKGYNITGLFINRSTTDDVGLFGYAGKNNSVKNIGVIDVNVTGRDNVGGLFGENYYGSVNNSYVSGTVSGDHITGGLVGDIRGAGTVNNSYATGNVTGIDSVGGLVGYADIEGKIINSYANGNVNGSSNIGGLLGYDYGTLVEKSYATGNVDGDNDVGGLMGCYHNLYNDGPIINSHYNIEKVSVNGGTHITLGGLLDAQYQDWYSSGLSLDISDYSTDLVQSGEYYDINTSQGLRDLLGFADVAGYKFRLIADLNLSTAPGLCIPYFAAEFEGDNHTISNLQINLPFAESVGMFGFSNGGKINNTRLVDNDVNGYAEVGGLVGYNHDGIVNNSYATGYVTGNSSIGGLVGINAGTVSNSYANGNVNGTSSIGGLVGRCFYGDSVCMVSESHASGSVTGNHIVGGLVGFNDGMVNVSYSTGFVTGYSDVGGLVGENGGTVSNSYATGNVNGSSSIGGLAGYADYARVSNSYATGNVTGTDGQAGGLVGSKIMCNVDNCFWDNETSGRNSSEGGTGKTTAEMKTQSTFTNAGWDFDKVWFMIENVTYPVFQWQDIQLPVVDAGIDQTVDEGTVVTFNGSGSSDHFGIANYTWTFRDGGPRTVYGVGPTYIFNDPGIFNVTLKVTNLFGYWNIDTMTVTVNEIAPPVSDAGPDQTVDAGTRVTFNGSGSTAGAGIVDYAWTFNDGAGDFRLHGATPSHTFNIPGVYAVRLNVTDARGNRAERIMNVTVRDVTPPAADAGPDLIVDQGTLVAFDGSASTDNVGIVNFTWTFTDGGPVTLYSARPTYKFDNPGIFLVILNAKDAASNRGADTMTVTVRDMTRPVADAGPDQVTDEGAIAYFDSTGSLDNVGVVNYTWTFVDGAPVTFYGARPTYIFDNPGIFTVSLNVTDAAGNWNIDTMTVTVKDITAPVADAGPDRTVDQGTAVTFNGNGSSDNVGVVNYTWTFDYGTQKVVLYGVSPSFTFTVPGVYCVQLNVSDAAGLWREDAMTLAVMDTTPPVAVAGKDQRVTIGSTVLLSGAFSTDNVGIVDWFWNFNYDGKAQSLEGSTVQFKFDRPGVYEVVLTVVDGAGNRGEARVVITVEPKVNVLQGLLWMPVLLIAMAVAGIAGYVVMRKRKALKGGPMQEDDSLAGYVGRNSG